MECTLLLGCKLCQIISFWKAKTMLSFLFFFVVFFFFQLKGFPDSSGGEESACNAGDSVSNPGSGRSSGEGKGNPLQYSWASLVDQLVKNSSAMQKTWVLSLGWEDPLGNGMATHSSISAWRIPGSKESDTTEQLSHFSLLMHTNAVTYVHLYCIHVCAYIYIDI